MPTEKSETPEGDPLDDKLAELDSLTLTDYPHRLDVEISMLIDPELSTEQFLENFERYLDDQLSEFPHVINCEVTEHGGNGDE